MTNKTRNDEGSAQFSNDPPPPSGPHARRRGSIPGAPRLKNREDDRKELAILYTRGKIGDPRKGEPAPGRESSRHATQQPGCRSATMAMVR